MGDHTKIHLPDLIINLLQAAGKVRHPSYQINLLEKVCPLRRTHLVEAINHRRKVRLPSHRINSLGRVYPLRRTHLVVAINLHRKIHTCLGHQIL